MPYTIGNIFYGINLNEGKFRNSYADDLELIEDSDLCTYLYSGNGDAPMYLGYDIYSFDECEDFKVADMKWQLPDSEKEAAELKLAQDIQAILDEPEVSEKFKQVLQAAKPDTWLVWSSS